MAKKAAKKTKPVKATPKRSGKKPGPKPAAKKVSKVQLARRIEFKSPKELKGYANNAKAHSLNQIELIAQSIQKFGFNTPILVDDTNTVIAGHGRLAAALSLKLALVPVVVLDHMTDDERRAYIIADNKIGEVGVAWSDEFLAKELADLDLNDFDLAAIGFSDSELDELLPDLEAEADEILERDDQESQEQDDGDDETADDREESEADEHDGGEEREDRETRGEGETQEIDVEKIPSGVSSETPDIERELIESFETVIDSHTNCKVKQCPMCAFMSVFEKWKASR